MARATTGTVFESRGKWYARVSLGEGKRPSFPLPWCSSARQAGERLKVLAQIARDLRGSDAASIAEQVLADAANATTKPELAKVVELVARVAAGKLTASSVAAPGSTFGDVAKAWTSGELAKRFPDHVKAKRSARDDEQRLRDYALPLLRNVPMSQLTLERLDAAMAALPEHLSSATRRQIGQSIASVVKFSVYPLRLMQANPIPRGWLPRVGNLRKQEILLTTEHDAFLASSAPLPVRLFAGFLAREGMRHGEAEGLTWADLDLDHGMVRLDANKTDDPRSWALRPGTARALKQWRKMLGDPKDKTPVFVDNGARLQLRADDYREHLIAAGIGRPALHKGTTVTKPTGLHALRALFVTEALARGESESWVCDRTGHKSSQMIATYKRRARTFNEAKLPPLAPLDVALGWAPESSAEPMELSAPVANRRKGLAKRREKRRLRARRLSQRGFKIRCPQGHVGSTPTGATRQENTAIPDDAGARVGVAASAHADNSLPIARDVEAVLAAALEKAAAAGQWAVVSQLARELEARRTAGSNVVSLGVAKKGGMRG